ncbi:hypothetical protein [Pseudomonas petrae]|uniref:hypothetical protein n=1 Tax=Pseudomonas petrae TaxID=2912190 RepID=UPI001F240D22|nr:hypothetical protein [Pseudomonas petrae]MCF7536169.1 hypothetical protein [Pseudomonas petrae]
MTILNLKWTKGAPKELLAGMIVRCRGTLMLIGTFTPEPIVATILADCTEYTQAIADYEIDWLNDLGVPARKVS